MDQQDQNPFEAPPTFPTQALPLTDIPAEDLKKIEAIIKDAGQFWLAMVICVLCSGIGMFIIPIWYGVRLVQWGRFSSRYPFLLSPGAAPGSLPQKFTSSRWKLIVGLVFGIAMVGVYFLITLLWMIYVRAGVAMNQI